jgi:hypothetical protein
MSSAEESGVSDAFTDEFVPAARLALASALASALSACSMFGGSEPK